MGTYHVRTGFTKSFTEQVLYWLYFGPCGLNYQQGLNRMWSRSTRMIFIGLRWHIGEQAVLNKEIYCVGSANPTQDDAVYGYQNVGLRCVITSLITGHFGVIMLKRWIRGI